MAGCGESDAALAALEQLDHMTTAEQHLHRSLSTCKNKALVQACRRLLDNDPNTIILRLRHCQIGDDEASMLSDALVSNTHCESIDLRNNMIRHIGGLRLANALVKNRTLTAMDLANNNLTHASKNQIRDRLVRNSCMPVLRRVEEDDLTLKELDMGARHVGPDCALAIAEAMRRNSTLTALRLGANDIGPTGTVELARSVGNSTALVHLDLGNNDLCNKGLAPVAAALRDSNRTVQSLALGANGLSGSEGGAGEMISAMLRQNPVLTSLDLAHNGIGDGGVCMIVETLLMKHASEATCKATATKTTSETVDEITDEVDMQDNEQNQPLKGPAPIAYLNLRGVGATFNSAKSIQRLVAAKELPLHTLHLRENRLEDQGARLILSALVNNMRLRVLSLHNNGQSDATDVGIRDAVARNALVPTMTILKESTLKVKQQFRRAVDEAEKAQKLRKRLGAASATVIERANAHDQKAHDLREDARAQVRSERELHLRDSGMGDVSAKYVFEVMTLTPAVKHLHLDKNCIGASGIACFHQCHLNALERQSRLGHVKVSQLVELRLDDNRLGDEGIDMLVEGLMRPSCSVRTLGLARNNIGLRGGMAFAKAIDHATEDDLLEYSGDTDDDDADVADNVDSTDEDTERCPIEEPQPNRSLRYVDLSGNALGEKAGKILESALFMNRLLLVLDMSGTGTTKTTRVRMRDLLARNKMLPILRKLRAEQKQKTADIDRAYVELKEQVESRGETLMPLAAMTSLNSLPTTFIPTITALDLHLRGLSDHSVLEVCKVLKNNTIITSLDLSSNSISLQGLKHLVQMLECNDTLLDIKLVTNPCVSGAEEAVFNTRLRDFLIRNSLAPHYCAIEVNDADYAVTCGGTLDLRQRRMGPQCFARLGLALKSNETIHTLELGHNAAGDDGIARMVDNLHLNDCVSAINVNDNNIGPLAAGVLGKFSALSLTLTVLNVRKNSLGDAGAHWLAHAIRKSKVLRKLDAGSNSIGDAGATELGNALQQSEDSNTTPLQILVLDGNLIGDEGAVQLARSLSNNNQLQVLSLRLNRVSEVGEGIFAHATGGASLTQTVLLRSFDPTKSFHFDSKPDLDTAMAAAKIKGPGGRDVEAVDHDLGLEDRKPTKYVDPNDPLIQQPTS